MTVLIEEAIYKQTLITKGWSRKKSLCVILNEVKDLKGADIIRFFALLRMTECHQSTFYEFITKWIEENLCLS